jgi:uncharacterized protein YndB with AHSA1/START domain
MTDLIERELELPASLDEVWAAITDPRWLSTWLADDASLELWPGGDARFELGDETRTGWVEEVCAPDHDRARGGRLAFWWEQEGEPASRVQFELIPMQDGTRLRILETRPLEVLDLVGVPLPGHSGLRHGPALVAA